MGAAADRPTTGSRRSADPRGPWIRAPASGTTTAFYAEQPDLNWRNPEVEQRMLDVVGFWLDRGVDGFRLDAVNTLYEDVELRDNPLLAEPLITLTRVDTQRLVYTRGLPELHGALRRLRGFVDRRGSAAILISEAYVGSAAELTTFYGADDEMHLPFNSSLPRWRGATPRRSARSSFRSNRHAMDAGPRSCSATTISIARAIGLPPAPIRTRSRD